MSACARCGTRYSGAARLCRNCGAELGAAEPRDEVDVAREAAKNPPFVSPSVGIRVCPRCGRVVPSKELACTTCNDHAPPIIVPPRADGAYWARVTLEYRCEGCKANVPLGVFEPEGGVACVLCNHSTKPSLFFWRVVLKHAHTVADLSGPDPEGRSATAGVSIAAANPFATVGVDVTDIEGDAMREDDDVPQKLRAGPGHPLCDGCRAPVASESCAECNHPARWVVPATATKVNRALRAIVTTGGVASKAPTIVALRCPTCSGTLELESGSNQATCRFCKTTSLIQRPTGTERTLPLATFLLFSGPSAKRTELTQAAR
jgi:hypothetical protein